MMQWRIILALVPRMVVVSCRHRSRSQFTRKQSQVVSDILVPHHNRLSRRLARHVAEFVMLVPSGCYLIIAYDERSRLYGLLDRLIRYGVRHIDHEVPVMRLVLHNLLTKKLQTRQPIWRLLVAILGHHRVVNQPATAHPLAQHVGLPGYGIKSNVNRTHQARDRNLATCETQLRADFWLRRLSLRHWRRIWDAHKLHFGPWRQVRQSDVKPPVAACQRRASFVCFGR